MRAAHTHLTYRRYLTLRPKPRASLQQRLVSSSHSRRSDQVSPSESPAATTKGKSKETDAAQAAKSSNATTAGSDELPLLQRPLGVKARPQAKVKSWADTKEKLLDEEKRQEERTHLAREVTRGYFTDLNATRRHGGKTWIAPKVMIREDRALYFPDIHGTPLMGGDETVHTTNILEGKVSVVALLTTRMSEAHTERFVEPIQAAFSSHPLYQFVQINLQDNLIKSYLVSLFASGIRKSMSEALWPTYMISNQKMEYLRQPLGIANKHVGYVYLVDPQLKIRWAGCGDPMSAEIAALRACTGVLLDRQSSTENNPLPQEQ